ncbi:MAG: hypothetical protein HN368_02325, partial [Spirochaetales bacterium]|nr:hypothetical protein [Spirochaetales bacterium]
DVLIRGMKISGILCEAKGRRMYVGIGLNCNQPLFPDFGATVPTSLILETGKSHLPLNLLPNALAFLQTAIGEKEAGERLYEKLAMKNELTTVLIGPGDKQESFLGLVNGIGPAGQLIVTEQTTGVEKEIYSGELVTFR